MKVTCLTRLPFPNTVAINTFPKVDTKSATVSLVEPQTFLEYRSCRTLRTGSLYTSSADAVRMHDHAFGPRIPFRSFGVVCFTMCRHE